MRPDRNNCLPPGTFPGTASAGGRAYGDFTQATQRFPAAVDLNRPQGYAQFPGFDECLRALKSLLEDTLIGTARDPRDLQPFNSRTILKDSRTILNIPAGFDAAANLAGINLAAANSQFQPVTLLTPALAAPPFERLPVIDFVAPQGTVTIIRKWGITVIVGDHEAALATVNIGGGPTDGSTAPDPTVSSACWNDVQDTMIVLPENVRCRVFVQNLDTHSPLFVQTVLYGWVIPVAKYQESLRSITRAPGYGPVCKDNQ